jgi:hypothetical protein
MIDITDCTELPNRFGGSEKKKTILFDGRIYMLKFPDPIRQQKNALSYMNNQFSEHIGCQILKSLGFVTQHTFLAKYQLPSGRTKIAVACEDFCQDGARLIEFSKLSLTDTESNTQFTTSIENVQNVIYNSKLIQDKDAVTAAFWDLFVADALIGNSDRHLDNWGMLEADSSMKFAPIYDCGSSLSPLLANENMNELLKDPSEFKNKEFNVKSTYTFAKQRIFYHQIFKTPLKSLGEATMRIVPRINKNIIHEIVQSTEGMSSIRKEYLCKALDLRYDLMLLPALKRQQFLQRENMNTYSR